MKITKNDLKKISNDVYDEIVANKIIRILGRVELEPFANYWNRNVHYYPDMDVTRLEGNGVLKDKINTKRNSLCRSNILGFKPASNPISDNIVLWQPTNMGQIRLCKSGNLSFDDFMEWLSENPLEILYELEEPIIEELPNSITLQGFDDTTMYIENSITPTVTYGYNALIPYKEELVKQREEISNNIYDIETNIIPYLTEMEYNLTRMEGN